MNGRMAEIYSDTIFLNEGPHSEIHSLFCKFVGVISKLFIIVIKLGPFSFGTIQLTQYYSFIINKSMPFFAADKNRRIGEIQSDTLLPNIRPYSEPHSLLFVLMEVVCKLFMLFIKLGQFSFRTFHLTQYLSCIINNSMTLFGAPMNRRMAEIQI
jgi:hypothetical protein